jgi:hypothetical protein
MNNTREAYFKTVNKAERGALKLLAIVDAGGILRRLPSIDSSSLWEGSAYSF